MTHIDLLDWTSFDAAIELGYRTTMEALDKAQPRRRELASSSLESFTLDGRIT